MYKVTSHNLRVIGSINSLSKGNSIRKNNAVYVHLHDKHTLTHSFGGGIKVFQKH